MATETESFENPLMRRPVSRGQMVIATLVVVIGGIVQPGAAILVMLGIAPAVPATLLKGKSRTYAYVCVAAPCFAFISYLIISDWHTTQSIELALSNLLGGENIYMFFACIALGWGLYYGIPIIIFRAVIQAVNRKIISKQKLQSELIREWGPEVTADAPVMIRPFNGSKYRKKYVAKPTRKEARLDQWEHALLENRGGLEIDPDCIYTDKDAKEYLDTDDNIYDQSALEHLANADSQADDAPERGS